MGKRPERPGKDMKLTFMVPWSKSKVTQKKQNIKCHADTQLFLCSLFSPVCLERPIYPCRSLCQVHIVITRAE